MRTVWLSRSSCSSLWTSTRPSSILHSSRESKKVVLGAYLNYKGYFAITTQPDTQSVNINTLCVRLTTSTYKLRSHNAPLTSCPPPVLLYVAAKYSFMLVTTITIDIFRLVLYSTFKPYIACDRPVDHVYNVGGKLFSEVLEGLGRGW